MRRLLVVAAVVAGLVSGSAGAASASHDLGLGAWFGGSLMGAAADGDSGAPTFVTVESGSNTTFTPVGDALMAVAADNSPRGYALVA